VSGTLSYLGSISIDGAIPSLKVSLLAQLPALQGQLAGLLNVSAAITIKPPSLTAAINGAVQVLAKLQAAPPSISFGASAILALIAKLQAQIAAINLQISLLTGSAGLFAYAYAGTVDSLGSSLSAATSGGFPGGSGLAACNALILATELPATWAALSTFVKVT
jgi:hypothetical protein